MLTRYDVRNACFRMKAGKAVKDTATDIIDTVRLQMLDKAYNWSGFSNLWDVVVKKDRVIVVSAITDIHFSMEVCAKRQMIEEMQVEKDWSTQESAVIDLIEAQFLEGIMSWNNYKTEWIVDVDREHGNRIITRLIKRRPLQKIEVTQDVIDAKIKEAMAANDHTADEARDIINTVNTTVDL